MTNPHLQIAKCGCNCEKCPTFKSNITTLELRQKCSNGWEKYLDIKLSPLKIKACDGCSIPDFERNTYYLNCRIRKCAIINEIENCAYCKAFPCKELLKAHSIQNISDIEDFRNKTGKNISESDFEYFVLPYMGLHHLNELRKDISDNEIKDFKKYDSKALSSSKQKSLNIDSTLQNLIISICTERNISFATLLSLEHSREQILRIIWTAALYGIHNENGSYLEVDSHTFSAQKINCMLKILQGYFEIMRNYDIHCAIIPKSIKGWLTPTGGLRKEGWVFRLSCGNELQGNTTLIELKQVALKLNHKFKEKAFRMFCKGTIE